MAKAYIISVYNEIHDPENWKRTQRTRPTMGTNGAQFFARGTDLISKEGNAPQRALILEFESMEAAQMNYDSQEYKAACAK